MAQPNILVVDDEPDIRRLVSEILQDEGYQVETAENGTTAQQALKLNRPDLILLDIWMPDIDGISLLKEWTREDQLACPVIMMSGHGSVETAVEATRLGAYDFVEKPLSIAKLLLTIERALEADKLQRENSSLRQMLVPLDEPIGKSSIMSNLREQIKRIANHDTWVLISGEAGTGKMSFARYLHSLSLRQSGPFIEVAAGSIAGENSGRELFGFEEGERVQYGLLEQANQGMLFIDEVADLDMQTQARLLSALQSQSVTRSGGINPVSINVRVVGATRLNLAQEVSEGRFREELYYQLNVVPIHIPPLREHPEDIPELLNFYIDQFVQRDNLNYRKFSFAAQNRLRQYEWPGNIRELKNLVQRLLILGTKNEIDCDEIEASLCSKQTFAGNAATATTLPDTEPDELFSIPFKEAKGEFERRYLLKQLEMADGSVAELSKRIGLERTNLYRKLRSLGIDTK